MRKIIRPPAAKRNTSRGRGISIVANRRSTYVATVAEVEVDRQTGVVALKRMVVAVDPGIVVNPKAIEAQIEGATLFSSSRALKEEVKYDRTALTTVDWVTYPILRFVEVPDIEVVLVNRPDLLPGGVGEPPNTTPAGDRQRDLRCNRCACSSGAVHARADQGRASDIVVANGANRNVEAFLGNRLDRA
ncbi:MAG: molybdopterin cofactor-binding domain-containing protein [Candidatus Lustribacter sp.]